MVTSAAVELSDDQMSLFDDGGSDLKRLKALRDSLRGRPRAEATAKGYSADWKSFVHWCAKVGRDSLPTSDETVELYVTKLLKDDGKKVNTALRCLSAITDSHRRSRMPVPSMAGAREAAATVRLRRREQPNRKAALTAEDLQTMVKSCDTSTARGCRDRAIIVLGFATSLRRSELAALQLSDVTFQPEGLGVFVRYSKTDQAGAGRPLGVWAGTREATDPLRVMKAWIAKRGNHPGPLFCRVYADHSVIPQGISGHTVADIVKAAASRVGLDASRYAGHSLRSGFVTAAVHLGRSDIEIARTTGHANLQEVRTYFRSAGVFLGRNPLEGVL